MKITLKEVKILECGVRNNNNHIYDKDNVEKVLKKELYVTYNYVNVDSINHDDVIGLAYNFKFDNNILLCDINIIENEKYNNLNELINDRFFYFRTFGVGYIHGNVVHLDELPCIAALSIDSLDVFNNLPNDYKIEIHG